MKVLIACEYSGVVRDAFLSRGHDAISCDLLPSDAGGPHYQGNVLDIIDDGWDLMIAHPECTRMANSGVRWLFHPDDTDMPWDERRRHPDYPDRWDLMEQDAKFFKRLLDSDIEKICIENSTPHKYAVQMVGPYSQYVQPHYFGSPYTKAACLWLQGLPELERTHKKPVKPLAKCHNESPGPDRWKRRSVTDPFFAVAMADQWGAL